VNRRLLRIAGRVLYTIGISIVCLTVAAGILIYHGPFTHVRDAIVVQAMSTNEQKYWATWFLSPDEINAIMDEAGPKLTTATQNVDAIKVTPLPSGVTPAAADSSSPAPNLAGVTVTDISGPGYHGKLMTVSDPARMTVGLSPTLGESGTRLSQIASASHAIGGVNAGGFLDDNFIQNGALPSGIVITNGVIRWQQKNVDSFDIIGFNTDDVLVVDNSMTLSQIRAAHLRDAVSFGPALVINGKSLVVSGGTTLQPRTAIGQRTDGTVLMLVIDGRQSSSDGATYATVADLMLRYGAYNAASLDGGSSTTMYWDGKVINSPCDILGERSIPTAFLVLPQN